MVRALVGKTVPTAEIAIVTDMDAERLYFVALHGIRAHFFLEEQALLLEPFHVAKDFLDLFVRDIGDIDGLSFLFGFKIVRRGLVALVQTAAPYVVDVVFVFVVKYVYHKFYPLTAKKGRV
jgi:hypothetical protein